MPETGGFVARVGVKVYAGVLLDISLLLSRMNSEGVVPLAKFTGDDTYAPERRLCLNFGVKPPVGLDVMLIP